MVVFCSLLRISFDVALLLLMMTLSRYVKIRTFPYGSWLTVITACDWTSCIVLGFFYLCLIQLVLYNWKYLQFSFVGVRSWMESSRYRQQTHGLLIYLYMWWFIIFLYAWWRLVSLLPTLLPKGMHSNGDLMHLCLTLIVTLNQCFICWHQSRCKWSYRRRLYKFELVCLCIHIPKQVKRYIKMNKAWQTMHRSDCNTTKQCGELGVSLYILFIVFMQWVLSWIKSNFTLWY